MTRSTPSPNAWQPAAVTNHRVHAAGALSRWLRLDVPHRIQRQFAIPITTVAAARERVTT